MSRNDLIHRTNAKPNSVQIIFVAFLIQNHLCHVLINIAATGAQSSITKADVAVQFR